MLVITTPNVSGINMWYPALYRPSSGTLRVIEIDRYRKAVLYLLLFDALLISAASVQMYDRQLIWPFAVTILTLLSVYVRRRLIPHSDCRIGTFQSTSIAPTLIIVEHMAYFVAIGLVCLSAARFAGDTARGFVPVLLVGVVILVLVPIANILVELVQKGRR